MRWACLLDEGNMPRLCLCLEVVPVLVEDGKAMGMQIFVSCGLVIEGGKMATKDCMCMPCMVVVLDKAEEFVVVRPVYRSTGWGHDMLQKKRRGSISNPGVRGNEVT